MIENIVIIIENKKGEILLLKRSAYEKWYPKKWCFVAEKLKKGEMPDECFKRGIFEETGIKDCQKIEKKDSYIVKDGKFKRKIYPYRCKINYNKIKINHEHSDYKWVTIDKIFALDIARPIESQLKIFYGI